jgi:hypothetical protein
LRICSPLGAATENGTSCSAVARFCAVTMICSMMLSSLGAAAHTSVGAASPRASTLRVDVFVLYMS